MTEKNLYNFAAEIGRHNKLLRTHYTDFNPDIRIALSGLIETFLFHRFNSEK